MLAGWVWRDDRLDPVLCEPIAQALCIVGAISEQSARQADGRQEFPGTGEVVAIAGRNQE